MRFGQSTMSMIPRAAQFGVRIEGWQALGKVVEVVVAVQGQEGVAAILAIVRLYRLH